MTKSEIKKRIEKLKKVINYHRYLFFVLDKQEISDSALDSLKNKLYRLEQQFPEFITSDSPTQRVAGKSLKGFKKVIHKVSMLSIDDVFSEKELQDWEVYLKKLIENKNLEYFTEPKIDGFAITLIYKKGIFEQGATRGNGKIGEDVTQNLKTIESIPLRINLRSFKNSGFFLSEKVKNNLKELIKDGVIEIRGEVYMGKGDFEKLNRKMEKKGEKTFANPRNLAAGSIRQLDPKLAASRPLKFFAYDIITELGLKEHSKEHQILSSLGFKTDAGEKCKNLKEVSDYYKRISKKREKLPFLIDGIVVSVNDNKLFEKLGVVGKSPRGIRAFKFPPKQAITVIKDIKVQVGRTGAITPVAILEPVNIDGVMVSRATLHNEDEIKKLGVMIGDTVIVERAGDVIPSIFKVLLKLRTGKEKVFEMPKICPSCRKRLIKPRGEVIWRCLNLNCSARRKKHFHHFVSRGAFDIDGLGPKIINRLIDENLISDPSDLFTLKEGDIFSLERFGSKSAKNLIEAIKSKKEVILSKFIFALGIRNIGEETANVLAKEFGSIKNLVKASLLNLKRIKDIGPIVAKSIYEFFQKKESLKFIEKLKRAGVKIKAKSRGSKGAKLEGLVFVLTGSLEAMSRKKADNRIRFLGGDVSKSVSKKTNYLIAGKNSGLKLKKAKKLGIKIINEKEFLELSE